MEKRKRPKISRRPVHTWKDAQIGKVAVKRCEHCSQVMRRVVPESGGWLRLYGSQHGSGMPRYWSVEPWPCVVVDYGEKDA